MMGACCVKKSTESDWPSVKFQKEIWDTINALFRWIQVPISTQDFIAILTARFTSYNKHSNLLSNFNQAKRKESKPQVIL